MWFQRGLKSELIVTNVQQNIGQDYFRGEMMGTQGLRKTLLVLMGIALSSCYGNPSTNSSVQIVPTSDYVKASCEFKADQGGVAPQVLPTAKYTTTYFGKKYDQSLLEAVLAASATETVRFAELTNVRFYSVSRFKTDSCLMSSFLPEAQIFYQTQFASVGKGVLGLYLSPKNSLVEKTNIDPTILVRQDANRWVLIHEFMHHLFSKEVQEIGRTDEDLWVDVQKADESLKDLKAKYKETKSVEDGQKMLNTVKTLVTAAPEHFKRFTLEEMTIESVLWSHLADSSLKNIPHNQAINGAAYIYTSAKKAEVHLLQLSAEAVIAESEARILQDTLKVKDDQSYISVFASAKKKIDGYIAELRQLKDAAGSRLRAQGIDPEQDLAGYLDLSAAASSDHAHIGCAHSKKIENFRSF